MMNCRWSTLTLHRYLSATWKEPLRIETSSMEKLYTMDASVDGRVGLGMTLEKLIDSQA